VPNPGSELRGLAFYDFDGTLVRSNVVHQYLWYARRRRSWIRLGLLAASAPLLKLSDLLSRRMFNQFFYLQYRGLPETWLRAEARSLLEECLRPRLFAGARQLVERNREEGFGNVLLTGSLDFSIAPLAEEFGFERVLANRMHFADGLATGRLEEPILAGSAKVRAVLESCRNANVSASACRAYSDDLADLPMLEAVGHPVAANPTPALRKIAEARGWPVAAL